MTGLMCVLQPNYRYKNQFHEMIPDGDRSLTIGQIQVLEISRHDKNNFGSEFRN